MGDKPQNETSILLGRAGVNLLKIVGNNPMYLSMIIEEVLQTVTIGQVEQIQKQLKIDF